MKEQYEGVALEKSAHYAADPSGMRTGNGPGPQLSETLEQVCADAEAALSANLVKQRVAVSMDMLDDKLANMELISVQWVKRTRISKAPQYKTEAR